MVKIDPNKKLCVCGQSRYPSNSNQQVCTDLVTFQAQTDSSDTAYVEKSPTAADSPLDNWQKFIKRDWSPKHLGQKNVYEKLNIVRFGGAQTDDLKVPSIQGIAWNETHKKLKVTEIFEDVKHNNRYNLILETGSKNDRIQRALEISQRAKNLAQHIKDFTIQDSASSRLFDGVKLMIFKEKVSGKLRVLKRLLFKRGCR